VIGRDKEGDPEKGRACATIERRKSFNTKEKVRAMVWEKKKAFVEGRQHVHAWETLQRRGKREQWLRRKK
jgi:hypothetical protein